MAEKEFDIDAIDEQIKKLTEQSTKLGSEIDEMHAHAQAAEKEVSANEKQKAQLDKALNKKI